MPKVSDVYKNLYHYTTWEGLLGILNTNSLWATHYRFLNDFSEIILFKEKLITLLYPYVLDAYVKLIKDKPHVEKDLYRRGGPEQNAMHDTEVIVNASYDATGEEIYILSFCGEHSNPYVNKNGLLSQWRGYGPDGGFSLVFNTEKFEEILSTETKRYEYGHLIIANTVYSDDDNKLSEEFSGDLKNLADDMKVIFNHQKSPTEHTELKGYYSFVNCVSRYKHCGFHEENEVRVIALPAAINTIREFAERDGIELKPEKERKFRKKEGNIIPYIELLNSPEIELPIERIIVGPHKEKESRAAALRVMLKDSNIEVSCSDIPFVS